jgi:Trypsin
MKFLILLACVAGALAFSIEDVDYENVVPIHETEEWKAAYPVLAQQLEESKPFNSRNGRVWGGRQANPQELPYQAGILVLLSRQAYCGGSVVSNNFVLSAASCFPG